MENMEDKLWLVEWCFSKESYRISRWSDPCRAVAYEDSWQDAVKDIKANYGIDGLIIFIRGPKNQISYYCDADYV